MVAALMPGLSARCAQPVEQRHPLAPRALGREHLRPRRTGLGGGRRARREGEHRPSCRGNSRASGRAEPRRPQRQPEPPRIGQHLRQRPAQRPLERRPAVGALDVGAGVVDEVHVVHARRAGRHAGEARQAAVDVLDGLRVRRPPRLQHVLDQVDAPPRAVELVAEHLVGRAGGGAEAAMHAGPEDLVRPGGGGVAQLLGGEVVCMRAPLRPDRRARAHAAGVQDAAGSNRARRPGGERRDRRRLGMEDAPARLRRLAGADQRRVARHAGHRRAHVERLGREHPEQARRPSRRSPRRRRGGRRASGRRSAGPIPARPPPSRPAKARGVAHRRPVAGALDDARGAEARERPRQRPRPVRHRRREALDPQQRRRPVRRSAAGARRPVTSNGRAGRRGHRAAGRRRRRGRRAPPSRWPRAWAAP